MSLALVFGKATLSVKSEANGTPFAGACDVVEVRSGQTLLVRRLDDVAAPITTVRMLGIEVPANFETEAIAFTREQVRAGEVALTLDKRRIDSQGRVLAYVYCDGNLLNAELVRNGLARVASYPGDSATIERELYRAQDAAVAERRGLWKSGERPRGRINVPEIAEGAVAPM